MLTYSTEKVVDTRVPPPALVMVPELHGAKKRVRRTVDEMLSLQDRIATYSATSSDVDGVLVLLDDSLCPMIERRSKPR